MIRYSDDPQLNFDFLSEHDPIFVQLATAKEISFSSDLNTTLIRLRQLGEAIAQQLAVTVGTDFDSQTLSERAAQKRETKKKE